MLNFYKQMGKILRKEETQRATKKDTQTYIINLAIFISI